MKSNIGVILGAALDMQSCHNTKLTGMKDCVEQLPTKKKNTYTKFVPNPENEDFKRKHLGVKKRCYKNK